MECIFCKIINKEISADIIYEDEKAFGILDSKPIAPGHTMIIPKLHSQNILEVKDEDVGDIFNSVKKVVDLLNKALSPDGFTIGINQGTASGQAIDHLHIHIIPRWEDDCGKSIHSVVNNQSDKFSAQIKEMVENFKEIKK